MAIVPFKLWEDMKRWKEEQIQKPRLPPDPNVSATAKTWYEESWLDPITLWLLWSA